MTSMDQDTRFYEDVIGEDILKKIINWITKNMDIEDVYDAEKIIAWAEENGYEKK